MKFFTPTLLLKQTYYIRKKVTQQSRTIKEMNIILNQTSLYHDLVKHVSLGKVQ